MPNISNNFNMDDSDRKKSGELSDPSLFFYNDNKEAMATIIEGYGLYEELDYKIGTLNEVNPQVERGDLLNFLGKQNGKSAKEYRQELMSMRETFHALDKHEGKGSLEGTVKNIDKAIDNLALLDRDIAFAINRLADFENDNKAIIAEVKNSELEI